MKHQITPIEDDLVEILHRTNVHNVPTSLVKLDGFTLLKKYEKYADLIENFEVRDDDIWVCSFPKTGTTWTQEMVWCIVNDVDLEGAKQLLNDRFPFFEITSMVDTERIMQDAPDFDMPEYLRNSFKIVENVPSPRFIKTHLPFDLLPRQLRTGETKAKIVYVARNAKDTCISYFHHTKLFDMFEGSFEDFCILFLRDAVAWAPFSKHILSYWKKRIDDNVLFLKFEDMKTDLPSVIKKTMKFLDKNLTTDQISILAEHLSFASMKANPAVNYDDEITAVQQFKKVDKKGKFLRDGNVDQWKTVMSPEFIKRFDDWTRENLKGTSLYSS